MFNKQLFDLAFQQALELLDGAERITKETLKDLSRTVLEAHHNTQDIGYVNRLVSVLTPMNKRTAILYFKAFTGFSFDQDTGLFGKKAKKNYDKALADSNEFLAEPHNNIWSWAERNVELEVKKLDLSKITVFIKGALKKAENEGLKQSDVLKAVFDAGVEVDSIIALMGEMYNIDVEEAE